MPTRPIVLYPDPVLLKPTEPVEDVDDDTRQLIEDMTATMYAAPGIGLAANQVGATVRVCIVDLSAGERSGELKVLVNPVVKKVEGSDLDEEGCLSFPEIVLEIERPYRATIEALDENGQPITVESEGLLARAMLHEIEHLDGKTFLRNISSVKREMVKRKIRKMMKTGEWVAAVDG
jgi:peptide deformylase